MSTYTCTFCETQFYTKITFANHDCLTEVTSHRQAPVKMDQPGGVKFDNGKPDFSHMTYEFMELHAKVREFGATKYARNNWKKGFKITRSLAAALRHLFKFIGGEDNDPESGLSHLGHAVCCIEHAFHDYLYRKENDDRLE